MKTHPDDSDINEVEKFETVFRELPAALALLRGPEMVFEKANDEYLQLVGRREILGKPLLEALPELRGQPFPTILQEVFSSGNTFQAREVEAFLRLDPEDDTKLTRKFVDVTYRRINGRENAPYGIFVFALDVTEKVDSRTAIHMEKQKLEAVFSNASAALAIVRGPQAVFEKANSSYLGLFDDRALIGKPLLEALPELKGQKFPELLSRVYLTGEPYVETEARAFLRRTGAGPLEERYFDQTYSRVAGASDEIYGVLIHAIDVTERVQNRRELAESAARFRNAIEAANLGTWDLDLNSGTITWSERASVLFGLPLTPTVTLEQAASRIHPEDQERVKAAIASATDPSGAGHYEIDYRIVHDDGSVRWLSLRGKSFFHDSPQGRITRRFSGTVLDVTERILSVQALRRSERQFRMITDVMPQVVWTARPDGVLDYTNERWLQYSGSSDPAGWLKFVHPEDLDHVVENWSRCVATGERYEAEFRLLRVSDQAYRWFLVRAHPSRDTNGSIDCWFGTCTDIEDQKNALAARSEFLSIASHELKTPLTSLKLQTQSMRRNFEKGRLDAFTPDKVSSLIRNTEKQVDRLSRLVDDMLDFSKIESGRLSMSRQETDISALVRESYLNLREQLENSGCDSQMESEEGLRGQVDPFRIEQVVTNLLTNASRYGKGRPVLLKVRRHADSVLISVSDHGIGIAPQNRERIFNRFERAVSANEISGLGLGLYISRQIVEAHRGRIWVESEVGRGSTFYVELPLLQEA